MSVIVKNMEMPKNCQECGLYIEGACYAKGYRDYRSIMDTAKPDDCPLVELPEKHGRLIDADKLMMSLADWWYSSFGQTETEESKAIKTVLDKIENSIDLFAVAKGETE